MNTPTPTPRTDAAWAKTFDEDENQCRAGNAATDMRDECAKIERELAALTAERDQLRAEVHRLKKQAVFDADHVHALNLGFATRAEVERSDALYQRACEVEEELRAEVKRMTHAYEYDHKCL
ncbi:MAG: hypothetical protein JHC85_10900, partial [Chthoniobacterales bacterium]|nr:hypothetical protein [Chthoniobacterales bacterium]